MTCIAIVTSIIARYDAISASVDDMARILSAAGHTVRIFAYRDARPGLQATSIARLGELLRITEFLDVKVVIWHFGIYYDLFDGILARRPGVKQIVCFHNVTPSPIWQMNKPDPELVRQTFRQIHNIHNADEVWPVSCTNAEDLFALGIKKERVRIVPLVVDHPPRAMLRDKATTCVELLYVGRFVRAKGVIDLVKGVTALRDQALVSWRLHLVGSREFSDPAYVAEIECAIDAVGLDNEILFRFDVNDKQLAELYSSAHLVIIPSYHEGFCKPVIEGLRAGCIPVGYAAYNLRYISEGLGRMLPPGDIEALGVAIRDLAQALNNGLKRPDAAVLPLDRGLLSVNSFDQAATACVHKFTSAAVGEAMEERLAALI